MQIRGYKYNWLMIALLAGAGIWVASVLFNMLLAP